MIRITVTAAAYEVIGMALEPQALRGNGESYSEVSLQIAR
jgi:hypothetical protein